MTKEAKFDTIASSTDMSWKEWRDFLDGVGAKDKSHADIAKEAYEKMSAGQASRNWWAQTIAVAYEQHIGRRKPGQSSDGTYQMSVSKTLPGSMDAVLRSWKEKYDDRKEFDGVKLTGKPSSSKTEKRRRWGVRLDDGSRVDVDIDGKGSDKAVVSVSQTKLDSDDAVERWRSFWKKQLSSF